MLELEPKVLVHESNRVLWLLELLFDIGWGVLWYQQAHVVVKSDAVVVEPLDEFSEALLDPSRRFANALENLLVIEALQLILSGGAIIIAVEDIFCSCLELDDLFFRLGLGLGGGSLLDTYQGFAVALHKLFGVGVEGRVVLDLLDLEVADDALGLESRLILEGLVEVAHKGSSLILG